MNANQVHEIIEKKLDKVIDKQKFAEINNSFLKSRLQGLPPPRKMFIC